MIGYEQFSKLKFSDFFSGDLESNSTPDWEWMNTNWFVEMNGFSWFGQPFDSENQTGGLELDLESLPSECIDSIFDALQLTIHKGDDEETIKNVLGHPVDTYSFVKDKITSEYIIGNNDKYHISCTINRDDGLVFLSILKYEIFEKYN